MANLCIKTPSSAIQVLIFQLLVLRPRPTAEDDLQEEVIEGQNGADVLDGNVTAIPIAEFSVFLSRHTAFLLGVQGQLEHPWTSS